MVKKISQKKIRINKIERVLIKEMHFIFISDFKNILFDIYSNYFQRCIKNSSLLILIIKIQFDSIQFDFQFLK